MKYKICLLFLLFCFSLNVCGSSAEWLENDIKRTLNHIDIELQKNHQQFKKSPQLLASFVDSNLIKLWKGDKTLLGMLGKKRWHSLGAWERKQLVQEFNNTLQRYVQMGIHKYDGQKVEFNGLKVNQSGSRALLTLKVIPNLLPSFDIQMKLNVKETGWQIYDVMIEGISYVSMKRNEFKNIYEKQGINGIVSELKLKNEGYLPSSIVPE
ncbi:phospholipid-binding protein MlaC [Aliikangiella sp. G2MR2-5]|uniref:MlaC/ttg2D family ABC transporter substrate-binding protein n=1 Tax=Aliikangiella sp. G2MR2-5 TaxID=2788943 RepID=UPI0018A96B04|nr:ABC transporter substrate-binding protein [Aliikangiella sp. G2MR2-5]